MSRGTTFILLKKSRTIVSKSFVEDLIESHEKSNKEDDVLNESSKARKGPRHPKFISSDLDTFDMVDSDRGIPYNVALEFTFNSVFSEVREMLMDQYGMDSYDPWKSQLVVTEHMAREMFIAANYILTEHFDEKIEKVMDNPFIDVIGTMSDRYSEWKYRLRFPNDAEPFEENDYTNVIESLKTILSAYLTVDNPDEYVLVAEVWG